MQTDLEEEEAHGLAKRCFLSFRSFDQLIVIVASIDDAGFRSTAGWPSSRPCNYR